MPAAINAGQNIILKLISFLVISAEGPIEKFAASPKYPALQYLESVENGSNAHRVGLRAGHYILKVGDPFKPTNTPTQCNLIQKVQVPCKYSIKKGLNINLFHNGVLFFLQKLYLTSYICF